jgi:2-polyprenyl-3-methyl-5-hydroxy-6-metoxy-1,4-benzoquinol methylase
MLIGTKAEKLSLKWFRDVFGEDSFTYIHRRFSCIINKYIQKSNSLVDAACGKYNNFLHNVDLTGKQTLGIDIDPSIKQSNKVHNNFLISDLHSLNIIAHYDVILSVYTWEHLQFPDLVLSNFFNILNYNGVLIIVAPQKYYYISILSLLLPDHIKDKIWLIFRKIKYMPFKTYFRLCDRKSLIQEATKVGFRVEIFGSVDGPPEWFTRFPPLFMALSCFTWLFNKFSIFENIRSTFIAVLRKEQNRAV